MLSSAISSSVFKAGTVFGAVAIALTVGSSARAATVFDITGSLYQVDVGRREALISEVQSTNSEISVLAKLSGTLTYNGNRGIGIDILLDFLDDKLGPDIEFSEAAYISSSSGITYLVPRNQVGEFEHYLIFDNIMPSLNLNSTLSKSSVLYQKDYSSEPLRIANSISELSGSATFTRRAVPSPAMLPALVGLGVTTWRRRQGKKLTTA